MLLSEERPAAPVLVVAKPRWIRSERVVRLVPPAVLLVFGLAELIRNPPLWYDEAYSRLAAGVPLSDLFSGVWHRTGVVSYLRDVPPSFNAPYYVLLHFWVSIAGSSPFALRLPSLLCAAAAVGVLTELTRRLAGTEAALLAGLLCALGPLYFDEAIQARDYGPALLALALCALWLTDWLRAPRGGGHRIVIAGMVAGLLHWFTLPVLFGFALLVLIKRREAGRRLAAGMCLAATPSVLLVGWSFAGGTQGAPTPPAVGIQLAQAAVRDWSQGWPYLSVALTVLALIGTWRSSHRVLVLCWFVLPTTLITAVELVRPTYFARYLLFALVGFIIAAALGVAGIRPTWLRRVVGALLVALSLLATTSHLGDPGREPSPEAVALLASEQTAGQPIIPADGRTSVDLETYLSLAPRLASDIVLPPTLFTNQTSSDVVWLVRVVLQQGSLPIVPAEQRLIDAGWTMQTSNLLIGYTTNLRVEMWTR